MQAHQGFDNASPDKNRDDLDRWRFALDIADVIFSTPNEWSVRIGLFGKWGSGKSTVLLYLEQILREKKSVVVHFNPSFQSNFTDVMSSFGMALFEELEKQGLYVEPKFRKLLKRVDRFRTRITPAALDAASEWFKAAKLTNIGLGVVSQWLKPDGEQIKKIRQNLSNQRLVVLIDDLDRTPKEVIPKLLLALREVLDLPRFTFVLAFDESIVSEALRQENPAWGEDSDFLEKILDFRYSLPRVTKPDKRRLLEAALRESANFVPTSSLDEVDDLFPDNPRKLKALVRGLRSLKNVLERHNEDELSWTDVWLVQLLRQESQTIADQLSDENIFDDILGHGYRILVRSAERENRANQFPDKTPALLENANLSDVESVRIKKLFEAMRARSSERLQYVLSLTVNPPAVTWKEFDHFLSVWSLNKSSEELQRVMDAHAANRSDSKARVYEEVVRAFSTRLDDLLNHAVRITVASDLSRSYEEIQPLQLAVNQFFCIPETLTAERLNIFYQKAQYWCGARRPGPELERREQERKDLLALTQKLNDSEALSFYEHLQPWGNADTWMLDAATAAVRTLLRDVLANILQQRIDAQLVAFTLTQDFVKKLGEKNRLVAFKNLLFPTGQWSPSIRNAFIGIGQRGLMNDDIAYKNIDDLAKLWMDILYYRAGDLGIANVAAFLRDKEVLEILWSLLKSRELVPRGWFRLLAVREKLIEAGANPDFLPLDERLNMHLEAFTAKHDDFMQSI